MGSDEYLNLKEAARYLGVSDVKMRRLVSNGLLKVSFDQLDERKKLVRKVDLETLKTPRTENRSTDITGESSVSKAQRGKVQ